MAIEEAKYLARLYIDELIGNLKVYEMVLDNDGVGSKITTEKVKSLALLAKVIREQTSNDSDSQGESDDDVDEEDSKAFNLLARNFYMFFRKGNRFGRGNRFSNGRNQFGRGCGNSFGNKGGESLKLKGACYNCVIEVLNKETIRIEESLNVIFDENLPEPKLSSSIEDVRINEPIVPDLNGSPSLKVNVLKESYPKSLKEARGHPIEQVIGELNERTLMSKTKQA
nr:hypothetical protein [Tanacetum cinerariifolium]